MFIDDEAFHRGAFRISIFQMFLTNCFMIMQKNEQVQADRAMRTSYEEFQADTTELGG